MVSRRYATRVLFFPAPIGLDKDGQFVDLDLLLVSVLEMFVNSSATQDIIKLRELYFFGRIKKDEDILSIQIHKDK